MPAQGKLVLSGPKPAPIPGFWVTHQQSRWIIEKAREFQKNISASLTTLKPLTLRITTNWKILKEMGISDHLTCLLRNLYAGQEATVRIRHGTAD